MKSGAVAMVVALLLCGCNTTVDKQLPREAAVAMTGSPATLNDISRLLVIEGVGNVSDVSQGAAPDAEPAKFTLTHYQRVMQFGSGRWRQDLTRIPSGAPSDATVPQRQITAVDGNVAYNMTADGKAIRQPDEIGKARRGELYHHPTGFLQAVFSERGKVSNTRTEGNFQAVDMTVDGVTYTMYVDPMTKLPAKITSMSGNNLMETSFDNWMDVQGHKMPGRITTKLGKWVISDITAKQQTLAGNFGNLAAPKGVKESAALTN